MHSPSKTIESACIKFRKEIESDMDCGQDWLKPKVMPPSVTVTFFEL